jgi:hypothetical protein
MMGVPVSSYRLRFRTWYGILVASWLLLVFLPLSVLIVGFHPTGMPFPLFLQQMTNALITVGSLQMLLNPPLGSLFFLLVWSPNIAAPLGLLIVHEDARS